MSKRKDASTKSLKAAPARRTGSFTPSISPETLNYMRDCEAREWMQRYRQKVSMLGVLSARGWWMGVKHDIARSRGEPALADLVRRMEAQRRVDQAAVSTGGSVPESGQR